MEDFFSQKWICLWTYCTQISFYFRYLHLKMQISHFWKPMTKSSKQLAGLQDFDTVICRTSWWLQGCIDCMDLQSCMTRSSKWLAGLQDFTVIWRTAYWLQGCIYCLHENSMYTSSSTSNAIFWERHKILPNLHLTFDWHYMGKK